MIYSKKANFPYPLLINNTSDYINPIFDFDIELSENQNDYIFSISCKIGSEFISKTITDKNARLLLIIKSKDNQFHELSNINNSILYIPKAKLSLSSKTTIQIMIQALNDIKFVYNDDVSYFYKQYKDLIIVEKGMVLGFSNIVVFDGSQKNPYDLFEKKLDNSITSDIEIRLTDETIMILYKSDTIQFIDIPQSRNLNNPYLYMGLQKALTAFIIHYSGNNIEDGVIIHEMDETQSFSVLDQKLLSLMKAKQVQELDLTNIDDTIHMISDNIIKKYVETVRGLNFGN